MQRNMCSRTIRVAAALGAVNDIQLFQRELELVGERFDFLFQRRIFHGHDLIEQRLDHIRIQSNHHELHGSHKSPHVEVKTLSAPLDDIDQTCRDRKLEIFRNKAAYQRGKALRSQESAGWS